MKSNHNGMQVHDVSPDRRNLDRRNLVDVLGSRAFRALGSIIAASLVLSGCSAPANSAPNKTTEITSPAQPGVGPEATQLDLEVSSPFGKEMQRYVDAANQNDKTFVVDELQKPSAVERTAKPEALEAALSFKDIKIEEESLEGRKLSELGIELGNHPILQKDGVSMADLYADFTIIVTDPEKDRNAWFDGLSEDAFATYFSQKAAVNNAPFGEETTKALKVLYETDPSNIGLALPMVKRELALAAASTNDSEIVMALLKKMAAEDFKPQIDKVVRIINQPEGQENNPVAINPSQIFIKGGKVHAGSIGAKASVSPPVADDQYPGGVDYALHTRSHGIAPDGKLAAASKIVASFHVNIEDGRVTMVERERGRMEYPLPKVPKPNNTETDPNKIG